MKSLVIITILFILFNSACAVSEPLPVQSVTVNFQVFYDDLNSYGQWVDDSRYGYIWVPYDRGLVPYCTNGQWIYTNFGWTWVSDYDWGWAPFHYGRWDYVDYYGWFWVPDYEWGPAWVVWRHADGYFGWVPMRPGYSVREAFYADYPANRWIFVRERNFENRNINRYVDRSNNVINNSTIINNTYTDHTRGTAYVTGPKRDVVQKATGREVRAVSVREINRPGQRLAKDQLEIYKPQIQKNNDRRPVPPKVVTPSEVRHPANRTTSPSASGTRRAEPRNQQNTNRDQQRNEHTRPQQEQQHQQEQSRRMQQQDIERQQQENRQQIEQQRQQEQNQADRQREQQQQIEQQRRNKQEQREKQDNQQGDQQSREKSTNNSRR